MTNSSKTPVLIADGASVSPPTSVLSVEQLGGYANAVAERVLDACLDDADRDALGAPTRFYLRATSNLEVEALVQLRNKES